MPTILNSVKLKLFHKGHKYGCQWSSSHFHIYTSTRNCIHNLHFNSLSPTWCISECKRTIHDV